MLPVEHKVLPLEVPEELLEVRLVDVVVQGLHFDLVKDTEYRDGYALEETVWPPLDVPLIDVLHAVPHDGVEELVQLVLKETLVWRP